MLFHNICNLSGPNTIVIFIHNTDQHVLESKHEALRVVIFENRVCNANVLQPPKTNLRGYGGVAFGTGTRLRWTTAFRTHPNRPACNSDAVTWILDRLTDSNRIQLP